MSAADHLVEGIPPEHDVERWLHAATHVAMLYFEAKGPEHCTALFHRIREVAVAAGDDYHVAIAQWGLGHDIDADLIELVRARGDTEIEAELVIERATWDAESAPADAGGSLQAAARIADESGRREWREFAGLAEAMAARSIGDLRRCVDLTSALFRDGLPVRASDVIRELSVAALLMRDEPSLQLAIASAEQMERIAPGLSSWAGDARHRLDLLRGGPSTVADSLFVESEHSSPITRASLWIYGREAIDAGAPEVAVDRVGALSRGDPHGRAILHLVTAAAGGDPQNWLDALEPALEQGLRLIAVDVFEGLAVLAGSDGDVDRARRLSAVANGLRAATGYRWRFPCEQAALDAAGIGPVISGDASGWEGVARELLDER
jgi:hypothetical protein